MPPIQLYQISHYLPRQRTRESWAWTSTCTNLVWCRHPVFLFFISFFFFCKSLKTETRVTYHLILNFTHVFRKIYYFDVHCNTESVTVAQHGVVVLFTMCPFSRGCDEGWTRDINKCTSYYNSVLVLGDKTTRTTRIRTRTTKHHWTVPCCTYARGSVRSSKKWTCQSDEYRMAK